MPLLLNSLRTRPQPPGLPTRTPYSVRGGLVLHPDLTDGRQAIPPVSFGLARKAGDTDASLVKQANAIPLHRAHCQFVSNAQMLQGNVGLGALAKFPGVTQMG